MFSSFPTATVEQLEEVPAKSRAPWVWFGFLFALGFLVFEFVVVFTEMDDSTANPILILIAAAGFIYWLFCIHRFHKILHELSQGTYAVGTSEAVWKHLIPFLNIIWIFQWPREFSDYLNRRGRVSIISGTLIGLLLLLSLILRLFDGAVGLASLFGVTLYLSAKLRRHMQLVKGIAPPPVADPSLFRQQETKSTFGTATE